MAMTKNPMMTGKSSPLLNVIWDYCMRLVTTAIELSLNHSTTGPRQLRVSLGYLNGGVFCVPGGLCKQLVYHVFTSKIAPSQITYNFIVRDRVHWLTKIFREVP